MNRALELEELPEYIEKTYDVEHLKKIHFYLFQDSVEQSKSGEFRLYQNDVHSKKRDIYLTNKSFFYEPEPSEKTVDTIIKDADYNLSISCSFDNKVSILSKLYINLDYEHPFVEGNSRTIRIFIKQLALKHNIEVNWSLNGKIDQRAREEFYRARDYEVANRNLNIEPTSDIEKYMLEQAKLCKTRDYISSQIAQHRGRYLENLIRSFCTSIN